MTYPKDEADHIRRAAAKFRNIVAGIFEDVSLDPRSMVEVETKIKEAKATALQALRSGGKR